MTENSKRVLLANVFSVIHILYRKQIDPCCVHFYQSVTITTVNNQWRYWQIDDMIVGLQFTKKKRRDNCIYRRIPITDLFVNSYLFFSISSWNANKERNDYTEDYMRCILKSIVTGTKGNVFYVVSNRKSVFSIWFRFRPENRKNNIRTSDIS